jgi:methylated-DNA-protein-cysteine methyltransferase-like protein
MEAELSGPEELYTLVRSIPAGQVASYGQLGRVLRNPVSGLIVGSWMARCPADIPWWRVVAGNGTLPVWKKGPHLQLEQIDRLLQEGVEVNERTVDMSRFRSSL